MIAAKMIFVRFFLGGQSTNLGATIPRPRAYVTGYRVGI